MWAAIWCRRIPTFQEFGHLWVWLFHSYRKTRMERSNRPKAKILQRNSLVVKMGSWQAASGVVCGRSKISSGGRSRENRPKHCIATTRLTMRSWVPCQPQAGACHDHWCRGVFCEGYVLLRRRWSPCVLMLWKAAGHCQGLSDAVLSKCACSGGCNCQWRSESESSPHGTESQGLCTASDSVVFTDV